MNWLISEKNGLWKINFNKKKYARKPIRISEEKLK